jgi:hypothetical protein
MPRGENRANKKIGQSHRLQRKQQQLSCGRAAVVFQLLNETLDARDKTSWGIGKADKMANFSEMKHGDIMVVLVLNATRREVTVPRSERR